MPKEMLINVVEGEECRLAVVEDGVLQELYVERASSESQVGNIYLGRVTNVEASIQAAFVDFGAPKNGFLHISDIQPKYFPHGQRSTEAVGKKRSRRDRPPIQECLRRGQEVVVQIIKDGIGTKGPTLTTYLSVPGRFLVMMPGMSHHGVSRKIEDEESRRKLRGILEELKPPADIGFIVRTAGVDRPRKDLQTDLNYLLRLWRSVQKRMVGAKAPCELYQESDLVTRTIRDIYSSEIARIICDNERVAGKVAEFLHVVMPRGRHVVKRYQDATPLFHRYGLEREIEKIYARRVELPGGGSLIIDQTEALVAIDVNSGRYRESSNAEETAYRTNLSAAKEVARQLRLRDMGGVIVIDFIDMREDRHQREIERTVRDAVKNDRARTKILKISRFGIVEMTRQRVRPSLKRSIYRECPNCRASGLIKSDESLALDVIRLLQLACANETIAAIELSVTPGVAEYLSNRRRQQIASLEAESGKAVTIRSNAGLAGDEVVFHCTDARGSAVAWEPATGKLPKPTEEVLVDVSAAAPPEIPEGEEAELLEEPLEAPSDEEISEEISEDRYEEPSDEDIETSVAQAERMDEEGPPTTTEEAHAPGPRKKRRRRGGRRHRRHKGGQPAQPGGAPQQAPQGGEGFEDESVSIEPAGAEAPAPPEPAAPEEALAAAPSARPSAEPGATAETGAPVAGPGEAEEAGAAEAGHPVEAGAAPSPKKRPHRRGGRRSKGRGSRSPAAQGSAAATHEAPSAEHAPAMAGGSAQSPEAAAPAAHEAPSEPPAAQAAAESPGEPEAGAKRKPAKRRRHRRKPSSAKAAGKNPARADGPPDPPPPAPDANGE